MRPEAENRRTLIRVQASSEEGSQAERSRSLSFFRYQRAVGAQVLLRDVCFRVILAHEQYVVVAHLGQALQPFRRGLGATGEVEGLVFIELGLGPRQVDRDCGDQGTTSSSVAEARDAFYQRPEGRAARRLPAIVFTGGALDPEAALPGAYVDRRSAQGVGPGLQVG